MTTRLHSVSQQPSSRERLRASLNAVVYMNVLAPSSALSGSRPETEPGVLAATKWIARGLSGPIPEALDLIAAVNDGLVRLGDPWEVTARGRVALSRHGWL
jgi:hypothetical protein